MERLPDDIYCLSTGRTFYALGYMLAPDDDGSLLFGWDGMARIIDGVLPSPFTPAECQEIAAYMQAQWAEWALGHQPKDAP